MTRPLTPEEREEVENLAYECETNPDTLRAYLTELIRLRSFAARVKDYRGQLPRSIADAIQTCLTKPATLYRWLQLWQDVKAEDPTTNLF